MTNHTRTGKNGTRNRKRYIPDMTLVWGHGVAGERGIHAGWERLVNGDVAPGEGECQPNRGGGN